MRILVLGGTRFLSREVARAAVARGHEVTCACRGASGPPAQGAEHVLLDRLVDTDPRSGPWVDLATRSFDAVVDVASRPSWVRTALFALGVTPHWVYVSSISAYADLSVPGGTPETTPVLEPALQDLDMQQGAEAYGRNKSGCETAIRDATEGEALIARAGLIVGPHDPSGRFTYWPLRLARGGPVVVPEPRQAPVQVVDVRDLADWLVLGCEERVLGTFDAVGPSMPWTALLEAVADGVGVAPELVWAQPERLRELGVQEWMGPDSLPLWLPEEYGGMADRDVTATVGAGLRSRSLTTTSADVLAWAQSDPDVPVTGLTAEREAQVLAALAGSTA